MSEWVSVEEELPEKWQQILVYIPQFGSSKDFIETVIYACRESLQGATHWMKLPDPPSVNETIKTIRTMNADGSYFSFIQDAKSGEWFGGKNKEADDGLERKQ